jgi:hypothetical protein
MAQTLIKNSQLSPIDATANITGILPVEHGGTGANNTSDAAANILPSQTGNSGKVLSTDGTGTLSWIIVNGGALDFGTFSVPAGFTLDMGTF